MKKKLVLKIGTSTLTAGTDTISYAKIEDLARQIILLREEYDIVIVSSGSIAAARQYVDMSRINQEVDSKQALAAIGQHKLMRMYDEVFRARGCDVAQCLLVYHDVENNASKENIRNTVNRLLEMNYTPIINKNDTVAVDEIVLGDNDKLSAYVAVILEADLLVLASDIDGLYETDPRIDPVAQLIPEVNDLSLASNYVSETKSDQGTGGMATKISAAELCMQHGIEMWIMNGNHPFFLVKALDGKLPYTRFRNASSYI